MQTRTFFGEVIGERSFQAIFRIESKGGTYLLYDLNDIQCRIVINKIVVYPRGAMYYMDGI